MTGSPLGDAMLKMHPHFLQGAENLDANVWDDAGIRQRVVFIITGRCGSTWLMHLLEDTRLMGAAQEFFSEDTFVHYARDTGAANIRDYIVTIATKYGRQGVFGFQINPERFFWFGDIVDTEKLLVRSGSHWIDMRRRNIVGQGFSFARARVSGKWHRYSIESLPEKDDKVTIPDDMVWSYIIKIVQQEQQIDSYYEKRNITPLRLFYEDMLENKLFVVMLVLKHLGLFVHGVSTRLLEIEDKTLPMRARDDTQSEVEFYERHLVAIEWLQRHRNRLHLPTFFRDMVRPQLRA